MSLFNDGCFTLHSGAESGFLIDCRALTRDDLTALAFEIERRMGPFGEVEGVPEGGLAIAGALRACSTGREEDGLLIADDVLTSGASMEEQRAGRQARGVVIFARGPCPDWVKALFQMEPGMKRETTEERLLALKEQLHELAGAVNRIGFRVQVLWEERKERSEEPRRPDSNVKPFEIEEI